MIEKQDFLNTMQLQHKWLGDDLLVFKNTNDCMTITPGKYSNPSIVLIELMGEKFDYDDCNYDWKKLKNNSFTSEEMDFYVKNYYKIKEQE